MQIGPQTYTNDSYCSPCYEYSVVSDVFGIDLYVLARDPEAFFPKYNATVYTELIQQGLQSRSDDLIMMMKHLLFQQFVIFRIMVPILDCALLSPSFASSTGLSCAIQIH